MSEDKRIDIFQLPHIQEMIEQKVRDGRRANGRKDMEAGPGRGKGNLAKATISRTKAFRGALCDDDWEDIAVTTFNRMMDPNCKNADFVKLATFLARYNLLSADAQMLIEADSGRLDEQAIDALKKMIKGDGEMQKLPKLG